MAPADAAVFLVEDDPALRDSLTQFLGHNGYGCVATTRFDDVVGQVTSAAPDLVLLDLTLPEQDGLQVCRALRAVSSVPVIVLTSRTTDTDELMAMTWGADDFVAKPFVPQVLLARIAAVLRRARGSAGLGPLVYRGLALQPERNLVSHEGRSVELTRNEQKILGILLDRRESIVAREELMTALWQGGGFVDDNTLTVNVNRLRRKLEEIGAAGLIRTVRGQGYLL